MTMARQILARMAFGVWNGYAPKAGPKSLPYDFTFEGSEIITGDLLTENTRGNMEFVQGMYVDNSENTQAFTIVFGITNQRVVVPAGAQGMFPVLAPDQTTFAATLPGGGTVHVQFLNVPVAYTQWGPITVNATSALATGSFTSANGAIAAAGVSQSLVPANAARKQIYIYNPGTAVGQNIAAAESLYIGLDGVAVGVNNGSGLELFPGGFFDSNAGPVPINAMTVNAATIGHKYTVFVM